MSKINKLEAVVTIKYSWSDFGDTKCACCEGGHHIYCRTVVFDKEIRDEHIVTSPVVKDVGDLLQKLLNADDRSDGQKLRITIERVR